MSSLDVDYLILSLKKERLTLLNKIISEFNLREEKDYILEYYKLDDNSIKSIILNSLKEINVDSSELLIRKNRTTITQEKKYEKKTGQIKIKPKKKVKNAFIYFTEICTKNNLKYYKYNASIFWTGPALILSNDLYDDVSINKIKRKFRNIELNQDNLGYKTAIYPKKNINPNCVSYRYLYESENNEICLIDWILDKQTFLLDESKNNVYDSVYNYLGKKKKNENGWYIDFDEKE